MPITRSRDLVCPKCQQRSTSVVDSRPDQKGEHIRRRRECVCGHRFTTLEISAEAFERIRAATLALELVARDLGIRAPASFGDDRLTSIGRRLKPTDQLQLPALDS